AVFGTATAFSSSLAQRRALRIESRLFDQGMDFMFARVLTAVVCGSFLTMAAQIAQANHGWGHHYHGYRGPVFGVGLAIAPPPPPPIVVAPAYVYPPAYVAQPVPVPPPVPVAAPVVVPSPVMVPAPAPVYAPSYSYGIMGGPRGVGFGVYMGR